MEYPVKTLAGREIFSSLKTNEILFLLELKIIGLIAIDFYSTMFLIGILILEAIFF